MKKDSYVFKKEINDNRVFFFVLIFIFVFSSAFYLGKTQKIKEVPKPEFSMLESEFVEYVAFQEKLNKIYPYYEPNGFVYKENLFNLLNEKESEMNILKNKLYENIPDVIERERNDGSVYIGAPTNLSVKEDFKKFDKVFQEYRDYVCNLREESWQGGSGSSAYIIMCQIYETEKYIELLKMYINR